MGEEINVTDIEEAVYNTYAPRQIAYETIDMFIHYFSYTWNRYFAPLKNTLENLQEFTVIDDDESTSESQTATSTATAEGTALQKYSDTPNQYLANPDANEFLTNVTDAKSNSNTQTEGTGNREIKRTRSGNVFEKWLNLSDKNRNIIFDFADKFKDLFSGTAVIRNYIFPIIEIE